MFYHWRDHNSIYRKCRQCGQEYRIHNDADMTWQYRNRYNGKECKCSKIINTRSRT